MKMVCLLFIASVLCAFTFEEDLHKGKEALCYVETPEDQRRLGQYAALFDLYFHSQTHPRDAIPRILHFIWLGPRPLPQELKANIQQWVALHPGWRFKFWTDHPRELPHESLEQYLFAEFPLKDVTDRYLDSDSFRERTELLSYAILLEEGGICVSHGMRCLKTLEPLREKFDFFCGLEPFAPPYLSSSVNPSSSLMGASPRHPIFQSALTWLKQEWDRLGKEYPGIDSIAVLNRVQHRSFRALSIGISQGKNKEGRKDIVLPPRYLNGREQALAEYAIHLNTGRWYEKEGETELRFHQLLSAAITDIQRTFLLALGLALVNGFVTILYLYQLRCKSVSK